MIKSLRIKNFILVKEIEVEFGKGLNVLTGETGAGKSVIVGAFALILGQKGRPGIFYNNQEPIYLEAEFDLSQQDSEIIEDLISEGYLDNEERSLIIAREILTDNSSRSYLNGKRVTIGTIKEFRDALIDFHSQRDQIKLFSEQYQLEILDTFGNLKTKRNSYRKIYDDIRNKQKRLQELETTERQYAEKQRLYEYQIAELEELDLQIDEEKELKQELDLLTHSEDILNYCQEIQQQFYESENSIFDQFNIYTQRLDRFKEDSESIKNVVLSFSSILQILNDVRRELRIIKDAIDLDENKMKQLEQRMSNILRIKSKYKMDISQLLLYLSQMKQELENYASHTQEIEYLQVEIASISKELHAKAEDLSLDRKRVSQQLRNIILKNISHLAIPEGDFQVAFDEIVIDDKNEDVLHCLDATGKDKIEFLFSANKGVQLQPLKNAISGGELSRLLLVIKKILAGRLDTYSLIFDEIDSGIGGRTANELGEFISEVGKYHQVLCITHLPQIAAYANEHYMIEKNTGSEKSFIEIAKLTQEERREEIARMLAGSKSETAMKHAEELLNKD
ncbi:MAG: DNA repair protein RecN [Candidatus Cloacimonetes bacterium]|nr:DNA repair protein RecN [Candidatus Cloacimonadota bacterium]